MHIRVVEILSAVLCVVATTGCDRETSSSEQELSSAELEELRGGVTADIVFPPSDNWYQTADNLQFKANIVNGQQSSSVEMTVHTGATKVASQVVSTPAPGYGGLFDTRTTKFPYPGKFDIKVRYLNQGAQEYYDAAGNPSTLDDMYIHPNVHLYKLKFWNTKQTHCCGGGILASTGVTQAFIEPKVDSTVVTLNKDSNTVDGVYYQCGSTSKTQWRFDDVAMMEVGGCTDMQAVTEGCVADGYGCLDKSCPAFLSCLNMFWNNSNAATDTDSVQVTFVDTLGGSTCDFGGFSATYQYAGAARTVTVLQDDFVVNNFVYGLTHELGHKFFGGHTDGDGVDCSKTCDSQGQNCVPVFDASFRNLMCSMGGRNLDPEQCDITYLNQNWATDQN